jgi:DoxX-like family
MNKSMIAFWIPTALLGAGLASGGAFDLMGSPEVLEGLAHLGYAPILAKILGVGKLLALVAILAPGFPRLKEWAYAGSVFVFMGAFVSHLAAGDEFGKAIPALVLLVLAFASWALRPANRVLSYPIFGSSNGK